MACGSSLRSTASTALVIAGSYGGGSAVNGIGLPGDERRFVRAQIERELRDLLGLSHPSDRLGLRQRLHHLGFAARIVLRQVAVDEGRVDARRADAIAAD